MKPIRVLVAEDHTIVRQGLVALIHGRKHINVIAQAANGLQAFEQFKRHHPDVCLIDLRMPVMDGLQAIELICQNDSNAKIIVLTTFDDDEDILRALRHGAKAYLLKDVSHKELSNTIYAVYHGTPCIRPEIAAKVVASTRDSQLTSRELDVLHLLTTGKSNKEIGVVLHVTEGTIKIHVSRILRKLNASARTEAVRVGLKRGLIHLD